MKWFLTSLVIFSCGFLFGQSAPPLPMGLGLDEPTEEPALPSGLEEDSSVVPVEESPSKLSLFTMNGFAETRVGGWLRDNPVEPEFPLMEVRVRVDLTGSQGGLSYKLSTDVLADGSAETQEIDLRRGQGWIDLREAWISFSPLAALDLKLGRQISTWGTGDLVFLNDLFPKDYRSFLLGRDEEMLKAPANVLRGTLYLDRVNLDFVFTPEFTPDRFITGDRLSYYSAVSDSIVGENAIVQAKLPSGSTVAFRAYHTLGETEWALYGYKGYWTSPSGQDAQGRALFTALSSLGASIRRPLGGGILNLEFSYYRSDDDEHGTNPMISNSEWRSLVGYSFEWVKNTSVTLQWSTETTMDYGTYLRFLPIGFEAKDETRHVFSTRITHLAMNQNLRLSLFAFYSPSDQDAYLRPYVQYNLSDSWRVSGGANVFVGDKPSTFFGQFEKNSDVYLALRYLF